VFVITEFVITEFVITEFVITEFVITEFLCIWKIIYKSFLEVKYVRWRYFIRRSRVNIEASLRTDLAKGIGTSIEAGNCDDISTHIGFQIETEFETDVEFFARFQDSARDREKLKVSLSQSKKSSRIACSEGKTFSQFHQHFAYEFFVQTLFLQLFSSYMYVEKAVETTFIQKMCS